MNSSGLDDDRAVQLLTIRGGQVASVGSGYLVARDLVLTAAHVVVGAEAVIVRRVVGRRQVRDFTGATEWFDADADIAVVRRDGAADGADSADSADGESTPAKELTPLRYGRVGDGTVSCQALGFPRFKLRHDIQAAGTSEAARYRDTFHAIGEIPPYSNKREGTLEFNVPPPEYDPDPPHSPWEGMSGAAVFAGGALIGVISEHHRSDGLGRLAAQRVTDWYGLASEKADKLRSLLGLPDYGLLDWVGGDSTASHYLDKVVRRDIAPEALYDREAELAELARFCTDDDPGAASYVWWRGPAWSGKSALLSWFALNPPPAVRTVAFFLREQVPHQNTWGDVADNLLQQLAAVTGRQPPTGLTDATRQEFLLALMDEAAETCRRRGERLVLVLDGLDEDRGDHSVAWLLPAEPPAGMRVIVAGRDHPPLPEGVLDDAHPLCDEAVVRVLAGSRHAKMMRRRVVAEIDRLAAGSGLEKLLLGLVTAARGALSGADLASLADCDEFEVRRQIGTVTGRTFTTQASRYRPDAGPRMYVLAHRDLPAIVEDRLGEAPLRRARQRLHTWFDEHREKRWPAETPEYLLHGYFSMLSEAGDVARMVACATDPARHHRMLDVTGGEFAALTEITAAQQAVLGQDDPDLLAMTRLAIHRKALIERNLCVSEQLPQVWAHLGNPVRAESLARSITQPGRRVFALSLLANRAAEIGDFHRVKALAADITEPVWRAESLTAAARAAADRGETAWATAFADDAESAIAAVTDRDRQTQALGALALAVRQAGDVQRAMAIAGSISDSLQRGLALCAVIEAVAATGAIGPAVALADSVADAEARAAALHRIAFVLGRSGDLDGVRSVTAMVEHAYWRPQGLHMAVVAAVQAGDFDAAETITAGITEPGLCSAALTVMASALAARSDRERARAIELARRAEAVVATLPDPKHRWSALLDLSVVFAQAGDIERAEAIVRSRTDPAEYSVAVRRVAPLIAAVDVDRAEALADTLADPFGHAETLRTVASAAGDSQGPARALAVLRRAEAAAADIADPTRRAAITGGMALVADANRDLEYRDAFLSAIGDTNLMMTTLKDLASRPARAGDVDGVVALVRRVNSRELLGDMVEVAVAAGKLDAAEALARSLNDPEYGFVHNIHRHRKVAAMAIVATAAARAGDRDRATRLAEDAEAVAYAASPQPKQWALEALAPALAAVGDIDGGVIVASYLSVAEARSSTLAEICEVAAEAGDADSAESIATTLTDSPYQASALAAAGRARARAGDQARAEALTQRAESVARSVHDPYQRIGVLMRMATAAVVHGDSAHASTWAGELDALAHSVPDTPGKQTLLEWAATAVAAAGDPRRAEAIAAHIDDPYHRAQALAMVAQATAIAGDRDRAENLVASIDDPATQACALAWVAEEISEAGDHPTAVSLAQRAVAMARPLAEDSPLNTALMVCVTVLARSGEIDRAETIARVAEEPRAALLWLRLALELPPPRARRAMALALALDDTWSRLIPTLAKVDLATVRAIVDEYVTVLGPAD